LHPDFETGLESLSYDPRRGSKVDFLTGHWTRTVILPYRDQKRLLQDPIDPNFSFVQSAETLKIARRARQAIFVDGVGLEPLYRKKDFNFPNSHGKSFNFSLESKHNLEKTAQQA